MLSLRLIGAKVNTALLVERAQGLLNNDRVKRDALHGLKAIQNGKAIPNLFPVPPPLPIAPRWAARAQELDEQIVD